MKLSALIFVVLFGLGTASPALAFRVEAQQVPSAAMNKPIAANVILPDGYNASGAALPVLYLLHGAGDDQNGWLRRTPIGSLADQYGIIVVCPNGAMSWYFDSPEDPTLRYETFISRELVQFIDAKYHTRTDRQFRAIAGNSMGGHGALFLAIRHHDVFSVAVALSGGVDFRPFPDAWDIKKDLGTLQEHPERWNDLVVVNQARSLRAGDLSVSFECGSSDFFINVNRALHQELLDLKIPHDYTERPGGHDWDYWSNAIKFQVLYIFEHFKERRRAFRRSRITEAHLSRGTNKAGVLFLAFLPERELQSHSPTSSASTGTSQRRKLISPGKVINVLKTLLSRREGVTRAF